MYVIQDAKQPSQALEEVVSMTNACPNFEFLAPTPPLMTQGIIWEHHFI